MSLFLFSGDEQEERCRSFIELTPGETQGWRSTNYLHQKEKQNTSQSHYDKQTLENAFHLLPPGVLWFSVICEFMYIGLLAMGFLLMCVEAMCLCAEKEMGSLKINAYAAMCTILSGDSRPCFLTLTLTMFILFVFHILPLCA